MSSSVALRIEGSFEDMPSLFATTRISASKITPNHPPPELNHFGPFLR